MRNIAKILLLLGAVIFLSGSGCVRDSKEALFQNSDTSSVQLRSFQSRVFDTTDKLKTLKTVIATMQDLGFVISKADSEVGVITGSKYANQHSALLTVTVRGKNDKQLMVRANVQQHLEAIEDAQIYQDFFIALEKAMFLTAQAVD
tara:strand:+ start:1116 stop:1553 length:438 start_codon:yes stop_codon:yes gene_type:complete